MHIILDFIKNLFGIFSTMKFPIDYIDILLVSILVYYVIKFTKDTRTSHLIQGVFLILIVFEVAKFFNLSAIVYILDNTIQLSFIAIIIVFQPELRAALERLGRVKFTSLKNIQTPNRDEYNENTRLMINSVCESCKALSERKIGALMVFELSSKLNEVIKTGISIDSVVTPQTVITIFFPNTPLHDGAVIISDNRIVAAGCLLPLSQNLEISKELGTRHRAAVGMTENTDAICIVVSEETGKISYAVNGRIHTDIKIVQLEKILENKLLLPEKKRRSFLKVKKEVNDNENK